MHNVGKLAGKTVFITGASRGIGKAIALKCARDGANIIIAAKTAAPNSKLPGTIYTAAKEIEDAGGKALPCIVDARNEAAVQAAVDASVEKFGGIDILVNNASAIQLSGTLDTSMKAFDLMHSVNMRATFLCSKLCIPHLVKSDNPHILNLSPPLNMKPVWFKNNLGYTMAKYGMSQCVLGMAEEFREQGIAVNALWPRTAIYTAAMEMLGGGPSIRSKCRKPDIVADAAYAILIKDSQSCTGNFFLDDNVLRESGVTDLDQYSYSKDDKHMADFFLDDFVPLEAESDDSSTSEADLRLAVTQIRAMLGEAVVKQIGGIIAFDLTDGGRWHLDMKNGAGSIAEGSAPGEVVDCTMSLSTGDLVQMVSGKLDTTAAFMSGRLKIDGDLQLAIKMEQLLTERRRRSKL